MTEPNHLMWGGIFYYLATSRTERTVSSFQFHHATISYKTVRPLRSPMIEGERASVLTSRPPTRGQIVLHLDMDCFFVACERLRNPDLEGEPVVIGGGFDSNPPRGAVATASYEAREHGVHSAQPMKEALQNLPRREEEKEAETTGIYLRGDHDYYREVSESVMSIATEYATIMRPVSIDEAYLDITDHTGWEKVDEYANDLKSRMEEDIGTVASVGVAPTLSCAKIASDHDKPDGKEIVQPDKVRDFLAPLDIGEIHGVGPVGAERFKEAGIETAGDLSALSTQEVIERFNENTTTLHDRVRGIDPREVTPTGLPKSISKEKSIKKTTSVPVKEAVIETLSEQVNERAISKGARYRTVGIKVVETPFNRKTREQSLVGPIRDVDLLKKVAQDLLAEFSKAEVRKLGVRVSNLDFLDAEQTRISDWVSEHTPLQEVTFPSPSFQQVTLSEYH